MLVLCLAKLATIMRKCQKKKQLERLAVAGGNIALRTIASFIMKLSGLEKKYRWFNTKEDALVWLKS